MNIFSFLPGETLISILGAIILSVMVFILRYSLNRNLEDLNRKVARLLASGTEGNEDPISLLGQLKSRYRDSSQRLEQVNTIALIETVYQNEKMNFFGVRIKCDLADGFTRAAPNLLIAFGLLGTVWGIAANLASISATLASQKGGNIADIIQEFKSPLNSMGTAFYTTLFGLFLSSILTVVNISWNTSLSKERLIASLEDYLDNIYKPTIEGDTRLDKIIDRMVVQQEKILSNILGGFLEGVRTTFEDTFTKAANQIAQECNKTNKIAQYVYTGLANTSEVISSGANTFQQAANIMDANSKVLVDSTNSCKNSMETFQDTTNQIEKNIVQNCQKMLSEFSTGQKAVIVSNEALQVSLTDVLLCNKEITTLVQTTHEYLQNSTGAILTASEEMHTGAIAFRESSAILNEQVKTATESATEFHASVDKFAAAANQIEKNNIIENLDRVLVDLATSQEAFTDSTQILQTSLADITSSNTTAAVLAQKVYECWQDSTDQMLEASEVINTSTTVFQSSMIALNSQVQTVTALMPEFTTGLGEFAAAANKVKTNNIIKHLNTLVDNLSTTQSAFTASTQTLAESVESLVNSHQQASHVAERVYNGIEKTVISVQSGSQNFMNATQQFADNSIAIVNNQQQVIQSFERLEKAANSIQSGSQHLAEISRTLNDNSVASNLVSITNKWKVTQNEFSESKASLNEAAQSIAKLPPLVTMLYQTVKDMQQPRTHAFRFTTNYKPPVPDSLTNSLITEDN
jgi:hypothetical protein